MEEFLTKFKVEHGDTESRFIDLINMQKYNIPKDKHAEFWGLYCNDVDCNNQLSMALILDDKTPVQLGFNLCLKFEKSHFLHLDARKKSELLNNIDNYVCSLISGFQEIICKCFDLRQKKYELIACYLRCTSSNIFSENESRVEFRARIIFPYAKLPYITSLEFYTYAESQMKFYTSQGEGSLGIYISNPNETITFFSKKFWELYGSTPTYSIKPLLLHCIYGYINGSTRVKMDESVCFSLHDHLLVQNDILEIDEDYDSYWLPICFTPDYHEDNMIPKNGLFQNKTKQLPTSVQNVEEVTEIDEVRHLISMISILRTKDRCNWIDIGQGIFSALKGSNDGLDIFKHFTRKGDVFDDDDCEEMWEKYSDEYNDIGHLQFTKATLEWFVKEDSPENYETYREPKLKALLFEALSRPETGRIGSLFKAYYPFEYIFDNSEQIWYKFCGHRWVASSPDDVMNLIGEDFAKYLSKQHNGYSQKLANAANAETRSQNLSVTSMLNALLAKIEKITFKEQLLRELRLKYNCGKLPLYLDRNRDLTGTHNGVLDLRNCKYNGGKPIFRSGKPEDYISLYATTYIDKYTWDTPIVKDTLKYISEVFRNPNIRAHFWRRLASRLRGGNNDKKFVNCVGAGDNSKSGVHRLIEKMLRRYFCTTGTTYLTSPPKAATDPDPVLSRIVNCRYVVFPEPNIGEQIQEGTVKKLSGRDDVSFRDLFAKGTSIKTMEPMFMMVIVSNKLVPIYSPQGAIWSRALVEEYTSTWCAKDQLIKSNGEMMTYQEQYECGKFIRDDDFEKILPKMAPAALWICTRIYPEYYEKGLSPPQEVLQATENYRTMYNLYLRFIRDCLEKATVISDKKDEHGNFIILVDNNSFVSVNEAYMLFRKWFYDQKINTPLPDKLEFITEMEINMKKKATLIDDQKVFTGFKVSSSIKEQQNIANYDLIMKKN